MKRPRKSGPSGAHATERASIRVPDPGGLVTLWRAMLRPGETLGQLVATLLETERARRAKKA